MKRPLRSLVLPSLALVAAIHAPALAHGGAYKGPPGEIPPDSRPPSDPPPPPEDGGTGTPGGDTGGGPTTGGGDVSGGPTTGGGDTGGGPPTGGPGGPPPSGGTPGGPTTGPGGTRGSAKPRGLEDWTFWWHANDDALLGLRRTMRSRRAPPSASGAHALGSSGGSGVQVLDATRAAVNGRIVPALREILADAGEDPDARSAAALGLAKIGDTASVPDLLRIVREGRRSPRIVEESAALALGLLPESTREIRETLLETVLDRDREGSFARPFAAIALGLGPVPAAERPELARSLLAVVRGRETGVDIKPCALQAIGLLGDPSVAEDLVEIARGGRGATVRPGEEKATDLERAHAAHALGRIGRAGFGGAAREAAVLDALLDLTSDREPDSVRRSATVALGLAGTTAEPRARRRLVSALDRIADEESDLQQRHYALVAIGRIAAAKDTEEIVRDAAVRRLRQVLEKGRPSNLTPPFAGLSMGLVAHAAAERSGRGATDEEGVAHPLRERFADVKDGKTRAAYAVALGLARDSRATKSLVEVLADGGNDPRLRGYAALALGMIGAEDGRAPVREALVQQGDRELRVLAAMAAGLLGDARAVDDLVAILGAKDESQYVLGSVALALGRVGDERAVDPLLGIATDAKKYPVLTRALAVVALGQIGDRSDVPTLARFSEDLDYRAATPALAELLTIL